MTCAGRSLGPSIFSESACSESSGSIKFKALFSGHPLIITSTGGRQVRAHWFRGPQQNHPENWFAFIFICVDKFGGINRMYCWNFEFRGFYNLGIPIVWDADSRRECLVLYKFAR